MQVGYKCESYSSYGCEKSASALPYIQYRSGLNMEATLSALVLQQEPHSSCNSLLGENLWFVLIDQIP